MATEYTLSINDLLKDTLPELPGVVRSVAQREMRLALREFFEKSYAWTTRIEGVAVPVGDNFVQLDDSDANTEVIGVLKVLYGEDLNWKQLAPMDSRPTTPNQGTPEAFFITSNPDEIQVYPYQQLATTKTLSVDVALIPAFDINADANTLPRQITLKYYDAIIQGFLARMYAHPNKPYSAPMVAQQLRHNFLRAIGFYAAQRKGGYNGSQNWGFPNGWDVARGNR